MPRGNPDPGYSPPSGAPWVNPMHNVRQNRVLELVLAGTSVEAAASQVGITSRAVRSWREKSPEFSRRFDWCLAQVGGGIAKDFVEFRRLCFDRTTPAHQLRICEAIEKARDDSITLILAPPEAGKTSLLTDLICFRLAVDPNYRICVVSEGQDLARKIVRQVARRMTYADEFPAFHDHYGPFRKEPKADHKAKQALEQRQLWNVDQIQVFKSDHDERDPSLEARGAGSRIYGSRYDLIVVDDICSTQNINSSPALLTYLRQDVLTRISEDENGKRGKTVIVGTRVGPGDVYERMLDEDGFLDSFVSIPAMEEGRSYWPERWPVEALERRKIKVGTETWARVYMQRPFSTRSATFTDDMIDACLDRERVVGDRVGINTIAGVDPALGGWCAITDASYTSERFFLLDQEAQNKLARVEEILTLIANHAGRYRPTKVVVEENAFQRGLANDDRLAQIAREYGFYVQAHKTGRNKQDPVLGVASMAGGFIRNEISIPWGDEASRTTFQPLVDELRAWRPDVPTRLLKQDRVMSMWFCWLDWLDIRQSLRREQIPQLWRPTWTQRARRGMWSA